MRYPKKNKPLTLSQIEAASTRMSHVTGRNPDLDQATDPEDLQFSGGIWIPPSQPQVHRLRSDTALDIGTEITIGTATNGGNELLIDISKNFLTLGVSVGDLVVNDTAGKYAPVILVSAQELECDKTDISPFFVAGDNYRVVSPTGAGAALVCVDYIDEKMSEKRSFYIMNGLNQVLTDLMLRVNNFEVCGASSREFSNVGLLTLRSATDDNVVSEIIPNEGVSSTAAYTIPKGYTGYLTQANASLVEVSNAGATISLKVTRQGILGRSGSYSVRMFDLSSAGGNQQSLEFIPPLAFTEFTDLVLRCSSVTANNVDVSGGFNLMLVKNA